MIPTSLPVTKPAIVRQDTLQPRERLIVALDVPDGDAALAAVDELSGTVGAFKVGMQLFTSAGPDLVRELSAAGHRVFLDLKYHDIPNTVANASVEATRLGIWMMNVHALGGREMMSRTADAVNDVCSKEGHNRPILIAVTLLTSSDTAVLAELGIVGTEEEAVMRMARLTAASGFDGVVASAREVAAIRQDTITSNCVTVTPGIRPADGTNDDQRRVMTPEAAVAAGSDYIVVGRPIMNANDRRMAAESIVNAIATVK